MSSITNTAAATNTETITDWFSRNLTESTWLAQHLTGMPADKLELIAREITELDADATSESSGYFSEYGPRLASAVIDRYSRNNWNVSNYAIKFADLVQQLSAPLSGLEPDFSFFKLRELIDVLYLINTYTRTKRIAQAKSC
jgi:hypothetical protein